jgi:MFS family permease
VLKGSQDSSLLLLHLRLTHNYSLGAPASFFIGCLADSYNRSRLFAWTVGIGEGACFLTYWTTTYRQLYICRAITGFSLGGALPLIYSVLGDLFAADERHTVNAIVGVGTGLGIAIGQGVAGFLGPTFGWRLPFLVVSIPALTCATAVLFTVQDPERGGMEQAVREHRRQSPNEEMLASMEMAPLGGSREVSMEEPILGANEEFDARVHWNTFWSLLSTPTVVLSLLQGAPGCVPWGIVNTYLNDFLSENRGMTIEVRIRTTNVATETFRFSLTLLLVSMQLLLY